MPQNNLATKGAQKSAGSKAVAAASTYEERAAMRERAQEMEASARPRLRGNKEDGETAVLEKLATMAASDRAIGERLHAIVKATAPSLSPKLWYGMPAYANKDGSVVCFFQDAQKFKSRYATLGFLPCRPNWKDSSPNPTLARNSRRPTRVQTPKPVSPRVPAH